jgi:hypothetical protein
VLYTIYGGPGQEITLSGMKLYVRHRHTMAAVELGR